MQMQEVPDPILVNDSDVLIKMKVIGVCGSDVHYYTSGKIGSQVVKYPFPVGHEGAGEVAKIGTSVKRVKVGDRIAIEPAMPCWECDQCKAGRPHTCRKLKFLGCPGQAEGCLSEYIVMPETSCFPIPDQMSYDEAAISEPLAIGVYAVNESIPMEGAKVGILGFGPIGMSVMLPALAKGASKVYVTDKVDERVDLAKKNGAVYSGNPDKSDVVGKMVISSSFMPVNSGVDLGLKMAVEQGLIPGPRLKISINILSQFGGHNDHTEAAGVDSVFPVLPGIPDCICDGPDECRKRTREMIRAGADWIKIATTGGPGVDDLRRHAHHGAPHRPRDHRGRGPRRGLGLFRPTAQPQCAGRLLRQHAVAER